MNAEVDRSDEFHEESNHPPLRQEEDVRPQQPPPREKHDFPESIPRYLIFVYLALATAMNAAAMIFGLGIGVGLILGDSLRMPPDEDRLRTGPSTTPSSWRGVGETPSNGYIIEDPPLSNLAVLPAQ